MSYRGSINKFLNSVVEKDPDKAVVFYSTIDRSGSEIIRLPNKPSTVVLNEEILRERATELQGYSLR